MAVAGNGGQDRAEPQEVPMRAVIPLHRHVGGDDLWVRGRQPIVGEAPALDHPWGEVGDKDIPPDDEPPRQLPPLIRAHVQGQVQLAGVVIVVVPAHVVAGLLLGERHPPAQPIHPGLRLYSHDRRPKAGHVLSADGPSREPREVRDLDPLQRHLCPAHSSPRLAIALPRVPAARSRPPLAGALAHPLLHPDRCISRCCVPLKEAAAAGWPTASRRAGKAAPGTRACPGAPGAR